MTIHRGYLDSALIGARQWGSFMAIRTAIAAAGNAAIIENQGAI